MNSPNRWGKHAEFKQEPTVFKNDTTQRYVAVGRSRRYQLTAKHTQRGK